MFCPKCRTEYVEGVSECADCRVPLIQEISENPSSMEPAEIPSGAQLRKVFETFDSYAFLDAAEALRKAGIPFTGDEYYTGEFRATRRAQAPYVWALLVPEERAEEASEVLGKKVSGEPVHFPPPVEEPMTAWQRWLLVGIVVAAAVIFFILAR